MFPVLPGTTGGSLLEHQHGTPAPEVGSEGTVLLEPGQNRRTRVPAGAVPEHGALWTGTTLDLEPDLLRLPGDEPPGLQGQEQGLAGQAAAV